MIHNRNEEIGRACCYDNRMVKKNNSWIWSRAKDYLFTEGSLEDIEAQATSEGGAQSSSSLKIEI